MNAIGFVLLVAHAHASPLNIPTKEIAPGVHMPVVSIGSGQVMNLVKHAPAAQVVGDWLDLGGRGIDTAWIYGDQAQIAATIAQRGVARKDLFITTKLMECLSGSFGAKMYIEANLKNLNTSYIDLFLIHAPLGNCENTWSVLEDYHQKGVLRAIGVSNFNKKNLEGLLKTAKVKPAVNQIMYNIFSHDDEAIQYCRENNITVEAFSPLGSYVGPTKGSVFHDPTIKNIAAAHKVSVAQVALKWIVQRGDLLAVLSGNKTHQANDADLFNFELTLGDMNVLDHLADGGSTKQLDDTVLV